jgi:hypothetical protein
MSEFIEKNRPLLRSYCLGARIIGWLLLVSALVQVIVAPFSGFLDVSGELRPYMIYRLCQQTLVGYVLLGLVLLGLAQFVRYLYESEYRRGLILRHGDMVLYLYALALVVNPILYYYFRMKTIGSTYANTDSLFLYLLIVLLPAIAKALILVGTAKVLKRMVPMVEESKTLV